MLKHNHLSVNERIRSRRIEMGFGEIELSQRIHLSISEYGDIESHPEEIYSAVPLYHIKKICEELGFDFLELFKLDCAFCNDSNQYLEDYSLRRSSLIEKKRKTLGWSQFQLAERLGFIEGEVVLLETYTAHLESWGFENVLWVGTTLEIPPQVLFDVKCKKCGK